MFFKKTFKKIYRQRLKKIKKKFSDSFNKERTRFISILNHDIKTPLLAQNQALELLLSKKENLNPFQIELLEELSNSNNFLLEIVTNSLFLTKYEKEKPELNIENINIVEEIKDCCKLVEQVAKTKGQNIIFNPNNNKTINLKADRILIQRILLNLISGSLSSGFEKSNIEISIQENKNSFSFCTKNKAVFMTKEKINSLFAPKKTLADFNQLGMNLNLNLAGKLIKAHNWDIIAESNKDNSLIFGFSIKK